ncbi:MAG: nucleotide pyrophosphohydrolase [Actinomycetota bacterium]|nr:nucleotide pyrophosphohydrolase [Actinomycetota bacterium]
MSDLDRLTRDMRAFSEERDWLQFHDPKSLVLALVGEVGELAELLQWVPGEEVVRRARTEPLASRLAEEAADVLLYLVRLADELGVDLAAAARDKLDAAARRYPVEHVKGVAPPKS